MEVNELISMVTPEIYQRISTAVELGKWPDGVALTDEQKEHCMQIVLLWQAKNNHIPEHMTVGTNGQITMKSKQELKAQFQSERLATLTPMDDD
ncbi:DUF1315 family protein [Proteus sp. G2669]|uniref:YeaC family protein n=1 Tax=Proteus sp. G2669 TaxID=2698881 RepID=UPI0014126B9B|nr:DUF1315 family protein [Proteus sp. G2669]NBM55577.1 DUF1315 family protein [Proteus sp. G2669]